MVEHITCICNKCRHSGAFLEFHNFISPPRNKSFAEQQKYIKAHKYTCKKCGSKSVRDNSEEIHLKYKNK